MADVRIEELDSGSRTVSGPTIGPNGIIYAACGQTLYAITPDGELLWSYPTGAFINGAPAVNADGTVFFGSADGKLYAVDPTASSSGVTFFLHPLLRLGNGPSMMGTGSVAVPSAGPYNAQLQNFDGTADSGWVPDDKFGSALNFDGVNDYVSHPRLQGHRRFRRPPRLGLGQDHHSQRHDPRIGATT